jgi:hypothetical protein
MYRPNIHMHAPAFLGYQYDGRSPAKLDSVAVAESPSPSRLRWPLNYMGESKVSLFD